MKFQSFLLNNETCFSFDLVCLFHKRTCTIFKSLFEKELKFRLLSRWWFQDLPFFALQCIDFLSLSVWIWSIHRWMRLLSPSTILLILKLWHYIIFFCSIVRFSLLITVYGYSQVSRFLCCVLLWLIFHMFAVSWSVCSAHLLWNEVLFDAFLLMILKSTPILCFCTLVWHEFANS